MRLCGPYWWSFFSASSWTLPEARSINHKHEKRNSTNYSPTYGHMFTARTNQDMAAVYRC